jgi:uncharacterized protein YlaI
MITQCCVCKKTRSEDDQWAFRKHQKDEPISHGYCPECLKKAREDIERLKSKTQ